jgi:hypothetical protein
MTMHFRGFFPKLGFLAGFSLQYIINFAGRISETAMGGAGGEQRPALRVNEPKKIGARSARACTLGQNPLGNVSFSQVSLPFV